MTIEELFKEVSMLNYRLKEVIQKSRYNDYDDLSGCDYDNSDPEQLFLLDELRGIMSDLENVSHTIGYLERPVTIEGTLHKKSNGRYSVKDYELTSGCGLEFLCEDDYHSRYDEESDDYINYPYWMASRIEHDGNDYYLVGTNRDIELEGLRVRIRR